MPSHITTRLNGLPEAMRQNLVQARQDRQWSQAELGRRVGIPQAHVSGIENGKIVPRFDTLLDYVRVLGRDLILIDKQLAPVVQHLQQDRRVGEMDLPMYWDVKAESQTGGDDD